MIRARDCQPRGDRGRGRAGLGDRHVVIAVGGPGTPAIMVRLVGLDRENAS